MKRLANLKKDLPTKAKLNKFQSVNLKGGGDKRKILAQISQNGNNSSSNGSSGG